MRILVVGAAGMVGRKFTDHLSRERQALGEGLDELIAADVVAPARSSDPDWISCQALELTDPQAVREMIARRPDMIFHLAAIVSGEAEADFDKGYRVNLDGTRSLFEAIRAEGQAAPYRPRVVFASSIAVFGAPFPERIGDEFFQTPLTSYGTQKAISELLLSDYSRRGIFDGIGLRLPTICIRPGAPNKAASGFFSNILREPLAGKEAVLPVGDDVRHWFASPRSAVGFLVHAAGLDLENVGSRRNLSMPGLSATVGEEIAALERLAGAQAVRLIRREPDPQIAKIVAGWPRNFETNRAQDLGFVAESDFDEIIRVHVEDELNGKVGS